MGKVDCVMEAIDDAREENSIEIAKNFLKNSNNSLEEISKNTGLPLSKIRELSRDF